MDATALIAAAERCSPGNARGAVRAPRDHPHRTGALTTVTTTWTTDTNTPAGLAVDLIDGIRATCRILAERDLGDPAVIEALAELRQDPHAAAVFGAV